MRNLGRLAPCLALLLLPQTGWAQDGKGDRRRPDVLTALVDCRAISDASARLTCYDGAVAALDAAERDKQVVVIDKEQVKAARRGLFGLSLPSLKLFSRDGNDDADQQLSEISSTVARSYRDQAGLLVIILPDGAKWRQDDDRHTGSIANDTPVTIRRGALGAYFASVPKRPGFKVKREN